MYINRKEFVELLGSLCYGSILSASPCISHISQRKRLDQEKEGDNSTNFLKSLLDNYLIIENHDPDNLLIIAYDLKINPDSLPNKNIGIYCYNLEISGKIQVKGKNVFILSNNIKSSEGEIITVGNNGREIVGFKEGPGTGFNRERKNPVAKSGDNIYEKKQVDEIKKGEINGESGGSIVLNTLNLTGSLSLHMDGGNGATGEAGQDGRKGDSGSNNNVCCTIGCNYGGPGEDGYAGERGEMVHLEDTEEMEEIFFWLLKGVTRAK